MTQQSRQKGKWVRPAVNTNGSLRQAVLQARKAAQGIQEYAADLRKQADALVTGGEESSG